MSISHLMLKEEFAKHDVVNPNQMNDTSNEHFQYRLDQGDMDGPENATIYQHSLTKTPEKKAKICRATPTKYVVLGNRNIHIPVLRGCN